MTSIFLTLPNSLRLIWEFHLKKFPFFYRLQHQNAQLMDEIEVSLNYIDIYNYIVSEFF